MPVHDDNGKAVGLLLYEDTATGNFVPRFISICFTSQKLKFYPPTVEDTRDLSKLEVLDEIRCQYITKVGPSPSRPKVLNCLEIVTTGVIHRFAVDSVEERDEWIEVIKQSSMRQGSFRNATRKNKDKATNKDVSYRTQIVGGVIRKIPIQGEGNNDEERLDLTSSGPASIGASLVAEPIKEGNMGKKIYKAGYATKCGAVMKSWKRRFFIVTEESFGYYKNNEETEPIRSVQVSELTSVGKSKVHSGKEHLLEVATPQRIFYIQGDSELEMHEWIKAFQSVITNIRTSTTLPVTAKERSNSQDRSLDTITDTSEPIQDYDSSPTTIPKKSVEQLQDGTSGGENNEETVDSDDDDDSLQSLGTKV